MRIRKIAVVSALVATAAVGLAACGNDSTAETKDPASQSQTSDSMSDDNKMSDGDKMDDHDKMSDTEK